jgi:hypothetical protein
MIDTVVITDRDEGTVTLSGPNGRHEHYGVIPAGLLSTPDGLLAQVLNTSRDGGPKPADPLTLVIPHIDRLAVDMPGGWRCTGVDADTGWYQLTNDGPPRVHLCVLDRLNGGDPGLFAPGWDGQRIARHLRQYRDLAGVPWYANAGVSGIQLARTLPPGRTARPLWQLQEPPPQEIPAPQDLRWGHGDKTGHRWDIRGMYLAAAAMAELGTDQPVRTGDHVAFDRRRAGWWLVVKPNLHQHHNGPRVWPERYEVDDLVWLTTPIAAYLADNGWPILVVDSWTSGRSNRHLHGWADTWRNARYLMEDEHSHPEPEVVTAIKDSANHAIGTIGKPGRRIFRPDWRATIMDLARINLIRKLTVAYSACSAWPDLIDVDSVWYPAATVERYASAVRAVGDEQREPWEEFGELLGVGPLIGRFKYEGWK